jgi:dienelactone hydrolase
MVLAVLSGLPEPALPQNIDPSETRVVVESGGWRLVGDLVVPDSNGPVPGVLMLNQAAGDRTPYTGLARELAARGVASLRLDLRGHGESSNLGRFTPGGPQRNPLIWDAEIDVSAAHRYLMSHPGLDQERIAVVGSSYSGEEMAEAGREWGYAQAYVALSPGSFSDESIGAIDSSGVPWLFVASHDERFLQEITAAVLEESHTVEVIIVPGTGHATDLLDEHPDLAERIAVWLAHRLR